MVDDDASNCGGAWSAAGAVDGRWSRSRVPVLPAVIVDEDTATEETDDESLSVEGNVAPSSPTLTYPLIVRQLEA